MVVLRVAEDARELNLLAGPGNFHEVVEEDRLLGAGYAAGGHGSGAFL